MIKNVLSLNSVSRLLRTTYEVNFLRHNFNLVVVVCVCVGRGGGVRYTHTSISFIVHLCCFWWVISWRSMKWVTTRNVGACAAAFVQASPDHISHTWRLPWAYQPVISWLKSTMSHSVNTHHWWRLTHLPWCTAPLFLLFGICLVWRVYYRNSPQFVVFVFFCYRKNIFKIIETKKWLQR